MQIILKAAGTSCYDGITPDVLTAPRFNSLVYFRSLTFYQPAAGYMLRPE